MNKIEQVISELEEYIEGCKKVPLSASNIYVNREQIEEMIRELRMKTPEEIKRYQKLISNRDAIIADAKSQADAIVNEAQVQRAELVNEHEIMQRAYEQANQVIADASRQAQEIVDQATEEANGIRYSAIRYTDDMLNNMQLILQHSIDSSRAKNDALIAALEKDLSIVISNRQELRPQEDASEGETVSEEPDDDGPTE